MDKLKIISVLAIILLSACNSMPQSNISNQNAKENIEPPKPFGCVAANKLSNQQNPADIFKVLNACISDGNYSKAAELYFAGVGYAYFDMERVSDKSTHGALGDILLKLFTVQAEGVLDKLHVEIKKISSDNSVICKKLTDLGAPSYYPSYMIQYGMGSYTGQSTEYDLVDNFDSDIAWKKSRTEVAECL